MKKVFVSFLIIVLLGFFSCKKEKTADIKPVMDYFTQLSKIPRCSKNESAVSSWLQNWAGKNGYHFKVDKTNSVAITVPASPGFENLPGIVLQGHMDMVCQKTTDSNINFATDPIKVITDGDYLRAEKTTLGADDGIGVAMALALADDKSIKHPTLELLFTTDEEVDMTGANGIQPDFLKGKYFINIDSEVEGVVTIGSAGGVQMWSEINMKETGIPADFSVFTLKVDGLMGGHSGLEILKGGANANKLIAEILTGLIQKLDERKSYMLLVSFNGGTAGNAITKSAEAVISIPEKETQFVYDFIESEKKRLTEKYSKIEKTPTISFSKKEGVVKKAFIKEDSSRAIQFVNSLPFGVIAMSEDMKGLVETSCNVGIVQTKDNVIGVRSYHRSAVNSKLESITKEIESSAKKFSATAKVMSAFPAWQPNPKSALLQETLNVYKNSFGKEMKVDVIHAGLECSAIANKFPEMQLISVGPTLKDVHTPDENLYLPSVGKVYVLIAEILRSGNLK